MLSVMKDPGKVPKGRGENESLILLVALCRFAEAVAMGMLVPILPIYLSKLGDGQFREFTRWIESKFPAVVNSMPFLLAPSAEARTALLFFLAGLAMAIAQIFAGRLSDRLDRRKIFIVVGMFGGAICSFLFVRTENYSELLITRILQTMFLGLTFPPMMAIVARYSDPGRGGRLLGMYSTIRLFGFALGPLVGGFVTQFGGYHTTFYTSALLLVISIGLVLWLVPDPREGPVSPRSPRSRPPVPLMFRLLGASTFLMMVGISAFISLFPSYQREWGAKEWELGLCFGSFIVTRCLFQYASGWLGDHSDKKRVLVIALAFLGPLILLQGYATSLWQVTGLRAVLGIVSAALSTSIGGISAERSLPGNRARVMGINTMCFSLGVAVGPLLTGFIENRQLAFGIPGVVAFLWIFVILAVVPGDREYARQNGEGDQGSNSSPPSASSAQSTTPA